MSLRLIEIFLPEKDEDQIKKLLQEKSISGLWQAQVCDRKLLFKILLPSKEVESLLDLIEAKFSQTEGFQMLLLPVEASIPRLEFIEETVENSTIFSTTSESDRPDSRIYREEIYTDLIAAIELSWTNIFLVFLSTLIAAIGLLQNSQTTLIGAMVIAPLLAPNMALALATTLADLPLAYKALQVGSLGIFLSLGFSILLGFIFPVSPAIPEIALRTNVHLTDAIVALASGMAGAISLTVGGTSAIVGVMVAVALLPPLVTVGLLLGSGHGPAAFGAMLLFLVNLICLNFAGVVTLLVQRVRPLEWWAAYKAKKVTQIAFWVWMLLLSTMIGIILLRRYSY